MGIKIRNVCKTFGPFTALKDINLEIKYGELMAFLGPSGSGKTTLLRIIAGLDTPDSGSVMVGGEDMSTKDPRDRHVGFVFQHYALFQHMTVFENIAFGLRVRPKAIRPSKTEIRDKVLALLNLVQLDHFSNRYPSQLSGGQRQRVALARALAVEPEILLLDEPFGSLDARVRKDLRRWLRRLHEEVHVTSIFVTHDQEEALEVADRLVIINEGRVEQIGSPEQVYHQPVNEFVYKFIGDVNLFHCRMDGERIPGQFPPEEHTIPAGEKEWQKVFTRPHYIELSHQPTDRNCFRGRVVHINPAGPFVKVELKSEWGDTLLANISQERYKELDLKPDMPIFIFPKQIHSFTRENKGH